MFSQLAQKALVSIRRYGLITPADRLICAVSGGPDSVCMVHILAELARDLEMAMILAHVNYHMRGEDSDLDEECCRKVAERLNIPMFVQSASPGELSVMKEGNFQREARKYRYEFFERLRADNNADKIAVGHTADDVAETTLMHFVRGSGISGLGGIYPRTGDTIRPLIDCSRGEIISYLEAENIDYRTDQSNLGLGYFRNRVRNDLIPYLEGNYNSQMRHVLIRTAKLAREADLFLARTVDELWRRAVRYSRMGKVLIDIDVFRESDRIIRYGLLRRAHDRVASDRTDKSLDYELVENAEGLIDEDVGRRADLNSRLMIERGHSDLIVFRLEEFSFEKELKLPGSCDLGRFGLGISGGIEDIGDRRSWDPDNLTVWADYDRMPAPYVVRTVREGDRVRLLNSPGTRKVSDLLVDRKVPRSLRSEVAIVTAAGRIVWIVGVGVADEVRITDQTRRVLKLSARPSVIQGGDEQGIRRSD